MATTVPERDDVSSKPYREITLASLVLGTVVGVALTISFTYAGLKLGFVIPASMVGAMLGLGVLKIILGKGSIVENNINQTVAAAINVSSGGVIFTVPVLYLMQSEAAARSVELADKARATNLTVEELMRQNPAMVQSLEPRMIAAIAAAAVAGALLGVFFIIPSRKQMIEFERLVFPSGVATAAILKASGAGPTRFKWLMTGIGVAVVFALLTSLQTLFPAWKAPGWYAHYSEELNLGALFGLPAHIAVIIAIAGGLTSFGGGYITGRAGLVLLIGAVIGHWVVTPLVVTQGWMPPEVATAVAAKAQAKASAGGSLVEIRDGLMASWAFKQVTRPLGVGMLLGGSIASVILTAPMLVSAIRSIQKQRKAASEAARTGGAGGAPGAGARGAQELNPSLLWVGVGVSFVMLTAAGYLGSSGVSIFRIVLAAAVATAWMWLANIIVSIATGKTDNSPLSGMALITIVLIVSILGREGAIVALLMAVSVCVATSQGSDMMQDLKTGHLVGAIPRKQQLTQLAVAWIGPLVSLVTLILLSKKFVFGNDPLTAPQGQAIKAALEIFVPPPGSDAVAQQVADAVPWRYAAGTSVGLLLTLGAGGGLGVVLGLAMYLPMSVTLTYCMGCAAAWVTEKVKGAGWVEDVGIPLAAGFLVGEGLAQVGVVFFDLARSALAGLGGEKPVQELQWDWRQQRPRRLRRLRRSKERTRCGQRRSGRCTWGWPWRWRAGPCGRGRRGPAWRSACSSSPWGWRSGARQVRRRPRPSMALARAPRHRGPAPSTTPWRSSLPRRRRWRSRPRGSTSRPSSAAARTSSG
jgi:OPT family oligopeptide transporter